MLASSADTETLRLLALLALSHTRKATGHNVSTEVTAAVTGASMHASQATAAVLFCQVLPTIETYRALLYSAEVETSCRAESDRQPRIKCKY